MSDNTMCARPARIKTIPPTGTIRFMSDTFLKSLTFFLVLFLDLQEMQ
ncbi:MAG: hypothetical protein AABW48_02295 [Nanoarchaeota archaeon]